MLLLLSPVMLGEKHDIEHEFPNLIDRIQQLHTDDPTFKKLTRQHDDIDKFIRTLELKDSPVSDYEMEKMKRQRLALKYKIFAIIYEQ